MIEETVTISLRTYKYMEDKINNLEQAIIDIEAHKECVTYIRNGMFPYSYWFYNPTEKTSDIIKSMNEISVENDKLRAELNKKDPFKFLKIMGI